MTNGTDTVSFLYDAEGKRISKSDGTNTFEYFYADGKLTRIKRNNTTLHFDYDMLGPSVIRYNGVDYYYHRNAQGDIDGISNAAGELVASYRYDAWGKPLSITGTMAGTIGVLNPFRYRGYVYDEETGLYYLNTRYYDPEIGRFISPDSVSYLGADGTILGYDLYTYCDNDPVNKRDSEGNLGCTIFGAVIGGLIGGISSAIKGENFWAGAAQGAASGAIAGAAADIAIAFCATSVVGLGGAALIAGAGGAVGSVFDDAVYAAKTGKNMDLKKSAIKAVGAGALNAISFGITNVYANYSSFGSFWEYFWNLSIDDITSTITSLGTGLLNWCVDLATDGKKAQPSSSSTPLTGQSRPKSFHRSTIGRTAMMCE
ncbi:MAG: RHS repeat-associated core domain-containing protein [Erysipelotrichales bacterium]|nr:RHS repeat-associated core domain-containing protein [Erysipelotrichales bacterium]